MACALLDWLSAVEPPEVISEAIFDIAGFVKSLSELRLEVFLRDWSTD